MKNLELSRLHPRPERRGFSLLEDKKNFLDGVGTFHIGRHSDFELEQDTGLFVTLDGEGCWMFDDHIMTNKT